MNILMLCSSWTVKSLCCDVFDVGRAIADRNCGAGEREEKGPKTQLHLLLSVFLSELRYCDSSERLNQLWFSSSFRET